jgi:hypothetical protein
MLNTPEAYREAGHKTATARRQHDEARAQFHRQWFTRAQALEQPEDRAEAAAYLTRVIAKPSRTAQPPIFKRSPPHEARRLHQNPRRIVQGIRPRPRFSNYRPQL